MRSPVRRYTTLWLSCLLVGIVGGSAWAGVSGEIAGVRFDPATKQITIDSKGKVGKHFARVMARPNRLVMDFENTGLGKVPKSIGVGAVDIREIRLGSTKSRARLVVDFQDRPVPPFQVRRADDQVLVVFGAAASAADLAVEGEPAARGVQPPVSALDRKTMPAAATSPGPLPAQQQVQAPTQPQLPLARASAGSPVKGGVAGQQPAKTINGWTVGTWGGPASTPATQGANVRGVAVAQNMEMNGPPAALPNRGRGAAPEPPPAAGGQAFPSPPVSQGNAAPAPGLPREVRPPVTPPTPDPRLLVQEITELKFIQVGHNSRLIIRGGDHLDYRLAKDSPTKLRIDLINAEIPKAHQKPLRTDLFSTAVEMIIPGSQTIFVQLKDAVTYQVEKEKGVLMVDFPPPRFVLGPDQRKVGAVARPKPGADLAARETAQQAQTLRREEMQLFRQQEIERQNEIRRNQIEMLQKQQEESERQRTELLRRYRVTPEPEAFSKKVSMDFQGISLKNAFRLLAEQAGMNIIVDDKVTGNTTLRLFQVPLGQVIDTILNSNNLDREMVGNVMRVGQKKDIQDLKKLRAEEYKQRMDELRQRIDDVAKQIREKDKEIKTASEELKKFADVKQEEVPIPPEEVRSEEIGEAGCENINGQRVCFFYARVKLIYADPAQIKEILNCMFNMRCGQAEQRASAAAPTYQERQAQVEERGFIGEAYNERMTTERAELRAQERTEAQQQIAASMELQQAQLKKPLAAGETTALQAILAHTILWADKNYNSLFIRDTLDRLQQMKKVILSLDVPIPQVAIESRIVQVSRGWGRGLGIVWGGRNNQVGPYTDARTGYWGVAGIAPGASTPTGATTLGNNIPSSFAVNLPATIAGGTPLGIATQFGMLAATGAGALTELDLRLSLGEASNLVNTIGRPKVQVVNKKKASIKLGKQIPYLTTSALGTQTQLINADLLLDVTPEIYADGRIRLDVKVTNNTPDSPGANPTITTREAKTIMTIKDGQTAVIGGILTSRDATSRQGWPGLMNVPVINLLFSNRSKDTALDELMVFLTPTIVKRPPSPS